MAETIAVKQGACPKCHSENITLGESIMADMMVGYKIDCNDCSCEAVEWYTMVYAETIAEG